MEAKLKLNVVTVARLSFEKEKKKLKKNLN